MEINWTVVASILAPFLVLCGTWLTVKIQHKGKPENALIDQLQEEVAAIRTEKANDMAVMRQDIADLKAEQGKAKRREMIRDNYINRLRQHIADQKPPPAPDWPEGLYD
jgi:hypothetical protein